MVHTGVIPTPAWTSFARRWGGWGRRFLYIYIYGDPLILDKNVQTATARSPSSANVHLHMTKTESQQTKYVKGKSQDLYSEINVQHLLKN